MRKQTQVRMLLTLLLVVFICNSASFAAFPITANGSLATPVTTVNNRLTTPAPEVGVQFINNTSRPDEVEGTKAKGRRDPGVLSFIFSMAALLVVGIGVLLAGCYFRHWLLFWQASVPILE